jgi:hypothetical protein
LEPTSGLLMLAALAVIQSARGSTSGVSWQQPVSRPILLGVTRHAKSLDRLLSGTADRAFRFDDLCALLRRLGFAERQRGGSHHIFTRDGVAEILNLQPRGGEAKPYQVRQVREVVVKYGLARLLSAETGAAEIDDEA